jgi:hypothetical protein
MKRIATWLAMLTTALAFGAGGARAGGPGCTGIPVTVAQAFACQPQARHTQPAVRVSDAGFDWTSAVIGAAAAAAVLLALGSTAALLRREPTTPGEQV